MFSDFSKEILAVLIFIEWMRDDLRTPLPVDGHAWRAHRWNVTGNKAKKLVQQFNVLVFFCVEAFTITKVSGLLDSALLISAGFCIMHV